MPDRKLDLDDLGVGQRFRSRAQVVTADDIKRFAREFDPQPFHLDEEAAKGSFFGGLAASGWHTAAITMRLIVEDGFPMAGGIVGSGGELLWTKPVRPGDALTVESEILDITPSRSQPGRATMRVRFLTVNQHGETVQRFTPKLVVYRRADPSAVDAPPSPPV